jgi:hypothetical protein
MKGLFSNKMPTVIGPIEFLLSAGHTYIGGRSATT